MTALCGFLGFVDPLPQSDSLQKCSVEEQDKVHCGEPGISLQNCEAINCCFDGRQCYYGNAVTIQCTRDGQFVIVITRNATVPRVSLDSISLLGGSDPPCGPVGSTAAFAIYQFPVIACGTTVTMDGDYVVYENRMISAFEVNVGPQGSITRDSHFELVFQCRYSGTSVEALVVEVDPVPAPLPVTGSGPLRVELRLANGQCFAKGCVEEDHAFNSYYSETEYPVTKVLREPVYVEVHILDRTDPNIVLMNAVSDPLQAVHAENVHICGLNSDSHDGAGFPSLQCNGVHSNCYRLLHSELQQDK
ncbi:hypothetical protein DNTS_029116 [Danionella cerebrum]|uniref:Zona pellucida sperm-binding protein 4 n=1 Tax=Danionella cerebrum TaxID=2873325 RepID=A0A553MRQ0_9TELE|nr:hypothetical protein DNTS_029116 [Danionella translucida]